MTGVLVRISDSAPQLSIEDLSCGVTRESAVSPNTQQQTPLVAAGVGEAGSCTPTGRVHDRLNEEADRRIRLSSCTAGHREA